MRGDVSIFYAAKNGEKYEDAACAGPPPFTEGDFTGRYLSAAVADGASEAILAGRWATSLVQRFTHGPPKVDLRAVLTAAVADWPTVVAAYTAERQIPWYVQPGLSKGAYATIAGVRFVDTRRRRHSREGSFDCWALGDSCLFQIRDDGLITVFPIDDPTMFGTRPDLVPSRPADLDVVTAKIAYHQGQWYSGDVFYLATDALAHWFLSANADGWRPWEPLQDLAGQEGFDDWVAKRRATHELRNDDVTMIRIKIW